MTNTELQAWFKKELPPRSRGNQADVARRIGVSRAVISRWLSGKRKIPKWAAIRFKELAV